MSAEIVGQPRVTRKLSFVALDRSHSHTDLAESLAAPTARLSVRLYGPCEFQQVAHAIIRIVNSRINCFVNDQSLEPAEVFIRKQRLLLSQTREVKAICTYSPR